MKRSTFFAVTLGILAVMAVSRVAQAAAMPVIQKIGLTKGVYKTIINKKTVALNPFPGYTGAIWSRRVAFGGTLGTTYLFVQQGTSTEASALKYYFTTVGGSLRTITPFYGNHYKGYNVDLVVQPKTKQVFIAFGTKNVGASARIMEVQRKNIIQVNNPTVADTADKGVVIVKFLKLYTNEYGLATMISGKPATLKVWRYSSSTHRFDRDSDFDTSRITVIGDVVTLSS